MGIRVVEKDNFKEEGEEEERGCREERRGHKRQRTEGTSVFSKDRHRAIKHPNYVHDLELYIFTIPPANTPPYLSTSAFLSPLQIASKMQFSPNKTRSGPKS